MFSYKSASYEKVEKHKPDKKFKKNSYEEIKKLIEDGDEMQLKDPSSDECELLRVVKL